MQGFFSKQDGGPMTAIQQTIGLNFRAITL
jgi:hypothetical protein